jgi:uncharacterized membrane protein
MKVIDKITWSIYVLIMGTILSIFFVIMFIPMKVNTLMNEKKQAVADDRIQIVYNDINT